MPHRRMLAGCLLVVIGISLPFAILGFQAVQSSRAMKSTWLPPLGCLDKLCVARLSLLHSGSTAKRLLNQVRWAPLEPLNSQQSESILKAIESSRSKTGLPFVLAFLKAQTLSEQGVDMRGQADSALRTAAKNYSDEAVFEALLLDILARRQKDSNSFSPGGLTLAMKLPRFGPSEPRRVADLSLLLFASNLEIGTFQANLMEQVQTYSTPELAEMVFLQYETRLLGRRTVEGSKKRTILTTPPLSEAYLAAKQTSDRWPKSWRLAFAAWNMGAYSKDRSRVKFIRRFLACAPEGHRYRADAERALKTIESGN